MKTIDKTSPSWEQSYVCQKNSAVADVENVAGFIGEEYPTGTQEATLASKIKLVGIERFRHFVRLILIIIRAVGSRPEKLQESNYNFLSWTVVYDEVLGISRLNYDSGALTFDPLAYKANKESTLSQEIKDILRLPSDQRTEAQIHAVMVSLHNVIPSFSEFPKGIQQSMIKVCTYERFQAGRVIIRQGHRAENFYFIISGCAVVTQMDSGADHVHTTNVLGKGNSFGELAFLHMSKRSATVTCRDDVELICIEREDFIDIFMRPHKGDEPDHIAFLKSIDLLKGWPVNLIPYTNPKICAFTYVRRGVILCHDSAKSDWIIVIYSGSCKVLKALDDEPIAREQECSESSEIQKISLAPNSLSFSKIYTTTACSSNVNTPEEPQPPRQQQQQQQQQQPKRHRKLGTSLLQHYLNLKETSTDNHLEELSPAQTKHLAEINSTFYKKHTLPKILSVNQAEFERLETPPKKVSFLQPLLTPSTTMFKPKRQSYGLQAPALPQLVPTRTPQQQQESPRHVAFIEITRLESGDIFGLEHVVLSGIRNVAACSLVSEGAEVVLINKDFFRKHLTEDTVKRIRQLIRPLPSEKALKKKYEAKKIWEAYKAETMARRANKNYKLSPKLRS